MDAFDIGEEHYNNLMAEISYLEMEKEAIEVKIKTLKKEAGLI